MNKKNDKYPPIFKESIDKNVIKNSPVVVESNQNEPRSVFISISRLEP